MQVSRRLWFSVSLTVLALLTTLPLTAQTITGTISGDVTDSTGAVIPNVTITVHNVGTGLERTATTSNSGSYRLPELPIGDYKVTATAQGFKTVVRTAQVATGAVTHADFSLQVGQRQETVEVEGTAPLIDLSPNNNNYVDSQKIENVPLNGRDFNSLLAITPGVQRDPGGGFLAVSINGARTTSNNYFIDGLYNNDRYYGDSAINQTGILGIPAVTFPPEAIQELSVQETPSAEFGVKGGAPILLNMKSGTNSWHGGATWINHSGIGDADNYFANHNDDNCQGPGECRPTPIHNNQFHANIGGPIVKDKAFFFLFYEGQRNKSEAIKGRSVPTQKAINAAFADIADKGLTVDPVGLALLNYFPVDSTSSANAPCDFEDPTCTDVGTITQHTPSTASNNEFGFKLDYKLNRSNSIAGRYIFGDSLQNGPPFAGLPPNPAFPQDMFNSFAPSRAQMAGISWTSNFGNNKILESRIGYTRFSQVLGIHNNIDPASLGIDTGPLDPADFGVPYVYMYHLGYGGYIGGVQGYPITTAPDATYDWSEHFSWVKGNHTIKLGGNFQRAVTNSVRNQARTGIALGYFSYYTSYVGNPLIPGYYSYLAVQNDVEQLLLGKADLADRSFGDTHRHITQNSMGFYAQDDWKIKPRLTVNYGLRYEVNGTMRDKENKEAIFDPVRGFLQVGKDIDGIHNVDYKDFAPHVGFAWDIFGNGKSALRGGYSLTFDVPNFGAFASPYSFARARTGVFTQRSLGFFNVSNASDEGAGIGTGSLPTDPNNCYNPDPTVRAGEYVCFDAAVNGPLYGESASTGNAPFNAFNVIRNFKTPRYHNFNLSFQDELFRNNVLTIGYSGQRGRNLTIFYDANASPIGSPCSFDAECDPLRPLSGTFIDPITGGPLIRHLITATSGASSQYDSLQVSFNQRGWHGLDTAYNFTWSKCFDYNSVNRGQGDYPQISNDNPVGSTALAHPDFTDGFGLCDQDVRFNFNLSGVYAVPDIPFLGKWAGRGWQFSTIYTALSGHPFSVFRNGLIDPSGQGLTGASIRGSFTGERVIIQDRNPDAYVNNVFVSPSAGTVGDTPRNFLTSPGLSQWDLTLAKNTKIGERLTVQLRWEVYNVLNRANFSRFSLDNGIRSSTFGQLTQTPDVAAGNPVVAQGGPRNMNLGIKLTF
jgi:Carboxypeptidase regulatory-like domain/TonB dependent receptor/TonB-dependent Receptor Plug Domain